MMPTVATPELLLSAVLKTLARCIADNLAPCRFSIDSLCNFKNATERFPPETGASIVETVRHS